MGSKHWMGGGLELTIQGYVFSEYHEAHKEVDPSGACFGPE